jgi:ABC-type multidrug transport system ATPase subunit
VTSQSTASKTEHPDRFRISAKGLGKRYNREWIFKGLDAEFEPGKVYAVTGPNGSGKSTLLQVLWGQIPQTSGSFDYSVNGTKIDSEKIYKHIAVAAPYMDLIDEFTLEEQFQFHFKLKRPRNGSGIADILRIGNFDGTENKFIGNFSSGLKQRIKLCLAFYTDCSVLFLDEPGTNLDAKAFEWYRQELARISRDRIIILASNNPVEYPADSIVIHLPSFKG